MWGQVDGSPGGEARSGVPTPSTGTVAFQFTNLMLPVILEKMTKSVFMQER